MAACAHGAGYDSCPPAKVAKEFNRADKGTGILKGAQMRETKAEKKDHAYDKKHGVKEGSKKDREMDKKRGLKEHEGKKKGGK